MIERRAFVASIAGLVAVGIAGRRLWAGAPYLAASPTPITV